MSGKILFILCIIEIPVVNANSIHPDQTPHSVASILGLPCLTITFLEFSRLKWIEEIVIIASKPHSGHANFCTTSLSRLFKSY